MYVCVAHKLRSPTRFESNYCMLSLRPFAHCVYLFAFVSCLLLVVHNDPEPFMSQHGTAALVVSAGAGASLAVLLYRAYQHWRDARPPATDPTCDFVLMGVRGFIGSKMLEAVTAANYKVTVVPNTIRLHERETLKKFLAHNRPRHGVICCSGTRGIPNIGACACRVSRASSAAPHMLQIPSCALGLGWAEPLLSPRLLPRALGHRLVRHPPGRDHRREHHRTAQCSDGLQRARRALRARWYRLRLRRQGGQALHRGGCTRLGIAQGVHQATGRTRAGAQRAHVRFLRWCRVGHFLYRSPPTLKVPNAAGLLIACTLPPSSARAEHSSSDTIQMCSTCASSIQSHAI